ncbi:hypothetical protein [Planctomyces sp. SH-PL14]|uniref:preprotein translocase subunit SecA n=1 Tax=Planctomyces sp. SH-PL14 TaxID=1632864 RepID=UPI00078C5477|nr:hypothetical protein [Planctomyces sp. SH-PL14]AMV20503.1 preprotein translocase subunit SecA [Planctomyces sp. SH-PL14]
MPEKTTPLPRSLLRERTREVDAAFRKALGIQLYRVQLQAGARLTRPVVVELATGEGKTFTSALPLAALADFHARAWLATANDYLARRDADALRPVFAELGMSVGAVWSQMPPAERRQAYACDITYGTLREFAFDHLKERLAQREAAARGGSSAPTGGCRELLGLPDPEDVALLLDECDSLLIDEARTPFLISAAGAPPTPAQESCFRWACTLAATLERNADYIREVPGGPVALTPQGTDRVIAATVPRQMAPLNLVEILHAVERAVRVNEDFHCDHQYLVRDGEVRIVDDYTGRISEGRRWSAGVQQAIEARESLVLSPDGRTEARITVQDFVGRFGHVSGMTGTAREGAGEFSSVYGLKVEPLRPRLPVRRRVLPPVASRTQEEKWNAVAADVQRTLKGGQSVLVGTRTVQASEELAAHFRAEGIAFELLNARHPDREAEIVARAGDPGAVTIATNMAGRGTDIPLSPQVLAAGGLHVIATEFHTARRIDRQLIGRCARQGDPGSARFLVSLEDEILDISRGEEAADVRRDLAGAGSASWVKVLEQSQREIESKHAEARIRLNASDRKLNESYQLLGLDPSLDRIEDPS